MKQLENMKESLVSATQAQLANLNTANAEELGAAIDIIDLTIEQEEIVADLIATFGREILAHADEVFRNIT